MKQKLLIILLLCFATLGSAFAQSRKITGTVTGADDSQPMPGVSVKVQGTSTGTQTNIEGNFTLSVASNAQFLEVSFLGYASQHIKLTSATNYTIKLGVDTKALSEVVVVGYQTIKRADVVGAVASVDSKEVEDKTLPSFTELLQGTAAGVQVVAGSGRPGDNGVVRIRGTGSITAGSDPLIVVDGIQVLAAAYAEINPDDIGSVTILKDAQAVAIYGSRGANGVILVTTKTGNPKKPVLSYSYRYGRTQREDLQNVTLMNSPQKLEYEYEVKYQDPTIDSMITNRIGTGAFAAGSTLFNITAAQRQGLWDLASARGAGDWSQYLFQNATSQTNELSLAGGDEKITYYVAGDLNSNPGVERLSTFDRKGGRLNISYQAKDWFKIGTNIGVNTSHDNRVREAYNTQNSYGALFFFNPYEQPYLADGSYNPTANGFSPLEGAVNNPVSYDRITEFGSFFGEASFFKHLTLKSQYAINYNTLKYQSYLEPGSNLSAILGYNQKSDQNQNDFFYSFTNTANWAQTVGKHSVNLLIGTEYDKDSFYGTNEVARGFPSKNFVTLDNASTPITTSTTQTDFSLISYFASAAYDYDKRYFISVSGRRDGSSRFGANVQFANFAAVGLAWDLKNEKFFTLPTWVSDLKLRGSYGTAGNNNIGEYQALGTYSVTSKYNDQVAATPLKLANPSLTWETTYQKDAGLTFGFLDSRLTGELDYYSRENKNLLYPVNVSATTGFTSYTGNVGAVRNSGIELTLTGVLVSNKDLRWSLTGNYSNNDNKITALYSDVATGVSSNGTAKLKVGEPINVYFLVVDQGVDPADGKEVYYNIDGTTTKTYSGGQAQLLSGKSPNVKYFGTVGTDLSYKGIDFSARFYYSGGNYIYNQQWQDAVSAGDYTQNLYTEAANYWKNPGDVVKYPNPNDGTQQAEVYSTKFLEKGDYVELRDVTLGYTLKDKFTKKLGIASLRFFAQGTNLAIWTKYHGTPETSEAGETTSFSGNLNLYGYPPVKGYTLGASIKF